jgi:hypothetical protein
VQDAKQVSSNIKELSDAKTGGSKLPGLSTFIAAWEFIALGIAGLIIATLVTVLGDNSRIVEITQTVFLVGVLMLILAFFLIRLTEKADTSKQQQLAEQELALKTQEQIDRQFNEATAQLGDESSEIRIAGVTRLAELADTHGGSRKQQVVDIFCGYLRTPRPELEVWDFLGQKHFQDATVESKIVQLMAERLQEDTKAARSWSDCNFDFQKARFQTIANWQGCLFKQKVDFSAAEFENPVSFSTAGFSQAVSFSGVKFAETADFLCVTFAEEATFSRAEFNSTTNFAQAKFLDQVEFNRASFWGAVTFKDTVFSGQASFNAAEFHGTVDFVQANFEKTATATAVEFSDSTWFSGAFNPPAKPKELDS